MAKNFRVDINKPTQYDQQLSDAEKQYGLPEGSLKLVMMIENRNNPNAQAVSHAGAEGLMQIMPANKKALGITNSFDPQQAIQGAAKLMSDAMTRYDNNLGAALADYNGGPKVAEQYLEGKRLNPETAEYLGYANEYINSGVKPSKYGTQMIHAGMDQVEGAPSDLNKGGEFTGDFDSYYAGLQDETEKALAAEAKYYDLSLNDSLKMGLGETMTSALTHAFTRENDANFELSDDQYSEIRTQFPQGLNGTQEARIRNSRSESDLRFNLDRIRDENEFAQRAANQTGWNKAGMYAGITAGGLLDPAALPLGTFGVAAKAIKGGGVVASASRMAAEGAAGAAMLSPVVQSVDKGSVDSGEVLINMGAGAVFGAGLGLAGRTAGWAGKKMWDKELDSRIIAKSEGENYEAPVTNDEGLAVNFREAHKATEGEDGSIIGVGPTAVIEAAARRDESFSGAAQAVNARRKAWYGSELRQKVTGWTDSEGLRLANSKSKVARFVGAMWGGDAAGLGKQEARNAAVLKEQMKDMLEFDYTPALKSYFERHLQGGQFLDYMAGGADAARADFSRAVQLERYKHRLYRVENAGDSKGYVSDAPAHIQQAAKAMDDLYATTKEMHIASKTEHAETLAKEDSVGYIEQRPDYIKLNKASPEMRKAFLDMVKDDYHAEATAKITKMKSEKAEYIRAKQEEIIKEATATASGGKPKLTADMQARIKAVEKDFDKNLEKLSKKLHANMDKRASHWWENALQDPESRYQNSEASLITLVREMSDEWFTGKEAVDEDLVKAFQEALTSKWADTSRRELNMLNSREVEGQQVYLLDMFNHDVFANSKKTINDTAGRVAMAKLGWRTEQDIADTLMALRQTGVPESEVQAAKHISDIILNRAKAVDDSPLIKSLSNMAHAGMMGKLGLNVLADLPTAIGNLGVGGMMRALGNMGPKVVDGSMFVRNGRLTSVGSDLDVMMKGLLGHDNELWVPQAMTADGFAMEAGGSLLRRTEAAARFTNTMSGANAVSKMVGTGVTKESTRAMHKLFSTGKGISEARLADIGLHPAELARIKKQFDQFATKTDFGLDKWTDPLAKETLIGATHRFTQQSTMNRSYAGDAPQWVRNSVLGMLYSRFRAIGLKAQEKVLVRNLTLADSNTVAMMVSGIAFATFLSYARIHMDAATSKDGKKALKERLTPLGVADQVTRFSSVLGLGSEFTGLLQLMTGGGVQGGSDTPLTGAVKNVTGVPLAVGEAITGSGSWGKAGQAGLKLMPGGNTYQMMLLQRALDE